MAYNKDLGRVKGDKGTTYTPSFSISNKKQYITWTPDDNTASITEEYTPLLCIPHVDSEGTVHYEIGTPSDLEGIQEVNIKGEKGEATIGVNVISNREELPNVSTITDEQKGQIYVIDTNEAYLGAVIWSEVRQDFVDLENLIKFNSYRLITDSYSQSETQDLINTALSNFKAQQQAIAEMIGGPIIIPDDE